jgi:hypothetical protein
MSPFQSIISSMTEDLALTQEELVAAEIQSLHWQEYIDYQFTKGTLVLEHPNEPMPKPRQARDLGGTPQLYDVVTRTGGEFRGFIQYGGFPSTEWIILEENEHGKSYRLDNWIVLAWKEHQDVPAETE